MTTTRIELVALEIEHAPALFACASDPEISGRVAWTRHATLDDSRRFIARVMVGYARGGHYEWGIVRRGDQTLIGTCALEVFDRLRAIADVSYALARSCWGQGYATEAVAAVVSFGFAQLELRTIEAQVFAENAASQRVMAKVGMRHVETRPIEGDGGAARVAHVWRLDRDR